jgi:rhamnosyltransferase
MIRQVTEPVCAVFVTYFPDIGVVDRLRLLLPQVDRLVIVDNTPTEGREFDVNVLTKGNSQVLVIENGVNRGIAKALNQGLEFAFIAGYKWLVTMDQDSVCHTDMVPTLLKLSQACEKPPAVVGSNYFDPQTAGTKVPAGDDGHWAQKTVITSGSLIDVQVARTIGGFREDFFIDQVDHEFCLRARAHGHTIVISRKAVMTHSVGRSGGVRIPFLGVLPNHPPVRKYYIARNTVVTVATHWRTEPAWCVRRIARMFLGLIEMALMEQHRVAKVCAFSFGVADGLRKQMGPCQRALPWMGNST